jgi:hypothetical protein
VLLRSSQLGWGLYLCGVATFLPGGGRSSHHSTL